MIVIEISNQTTARDVMGSIMDTLQADDLPLDVVVWEKGEIDLLKLGSTSATEINEILKKQVITTYFRIRTTFCLDSKDLDSHFFNEFQKNDSFENFLKNFKEEANKSPVNSALRKVVLSVDSFSVDSRIKCFCELSEEEDSLKFGEIRTSISEQTRIHNEFGCVK